MFRPINRGRHMHLIYIWRSSVYVCARFDSANYREKGDCFIYGNKCRKRSSIY